MATRIQVIMDEAERDELRRLAREEGLSLSAWLREAGRAKARAERARRSFGSAAELADFFAACDARETGREPDWEEHLRVIEGSRSEGLGSAR